MDSCSKQQQGRNILLQITNKQTNKQTNNYSIKQVFNLTKKKTFIANAGFNWTDEIIVHEPGWGYGFMVELPASIRVAV